MLYVTLAGPDQGELSRVRYLIEPVLKAAEVVCVINDIQTREVPVVKENS